ncbi:hypothetical protein BamMEX5DRAFT_6920 [Burkholderia ambifaria MEX-5]|uniref:Uncharacterized protein n=1 Tax=Burkholderia ambifaria MEX-5 TaxID=396597 RepID=B1TGK4_9BURK|nr:hypothetical protein BamMEX5DRAFT_6920 [Burkholderia ambifaria MEX-5]
MSANASFGMSGCRTTLCGWPTSSSVEKPLTCANVVFAYVMMLSASVVDISVTSSGNSNSCWVTGWLLRMQGSERRIRKQDPRRAKIALSSRKTVDRFTTLSSLLSAIHRKTLIPLRIK